MAPLVNHTRVVDLNHPLEGDVGCDGCACNANQNSDGIADLALKFRTGTTLEALGIGLGDSVVTVELTGTLFDGSSFVARDCLVVMPPNAEQAGLNVGSNASDTFIELTPLDLNLDGDGFADFARSYYNGTVLTLTAPARSEGRRFVRWSVDGVLHDVGVRTLELVVAQDLSLRAIYERGRRLRPDRPTEDGGSEE
jgi:hypothetical protein